MCPRPGCGREEVDADFLTVMCVSVCGGGWSLDRRKITPSEEAQPQTPVSSWPILSF